MIEHPKSLGIFASYFVLIGALVLVIARTAPVRPAAPYLVLTAVSVLTTWYYMLMYFATSFAEWQLATAHSEYTMGNWLSETKLFEQAWTYVSATPGRYWWSQQICFWSVIVTSFMAHKAELYRIRHLWAYMLLGQVVAMSVNSNLVFGVAAAVEQRAARRGKRPAGRSPRVRTSTLSSVLLVLSFAPLSMLADVTSRWFMPALLSLHSVIFVPLAVGGAPHPWANVAIALLSSALQLWQGVLTGRDAIVATLLEAPTTAAQYAIKSVIADVFCSVAGLAVWVAQHPDQRPLLLLAVPVLGTATGGFLINQL
ncbi:uncharacterized protein V1510DRAFT_414898 [Dipodascopsis tothii]|uniref:uncharacterized protein n=1 Tax=Dipodascopsis tothii TaxID=44089 RepID=UPI0034CE7C7C